MFINPILLWGLAGISLPIVIHLLNRFRHKEVDWAAMALLRRALVVRSRQVRIEDLLILVLRCLAVLLLALAMARPTIRSAGGLLGKDAQVGVLVALDGSYSMAHRPGVHSRFRRAVGRV
ncbi:BatA domain-containing protein, partial [bacterium]|nr:BatA domain-containing protein [bacterium]